MREFELSMRLRNNLLKRRRLELGLNPRELAEAAGIGYGLYLSFENLRKSPISEKTKERTWVPSALALAKFHGLDPSDLWPDIVVAVRTPEVVAEVTGDEAMALADYANTLELPPTPEDLLSLAERNESIQKAIDSLSPIERDVVVRRLDESLGDIGGSHGLSKERIRQIEDRALRKLNRTLAG